MKVMALILSILTSCQIINSQSPTPSQTIILTQVGKTFAIELPSNVSSGNSWILAKKIDADFLELESTDYKDLEAEVDGAPGLDIFSFKAIAKGETELEFVYKFAWEKATPKNAPRKKIKVKIQ